MQNSVQKAGPEASSAVCGLWTQKKKITHGPVKLCARFTLCHSICISSHTSIWAREYIFSHASCISRRKMCQEFSCILIELYVLYHICYNISFVSGRCFPFVDGPGDQFPLLHTNEEHVWNLVFWRIFSWFFEAHF